MALTERRDARARFGRAFSCLELYLRTPRNLHTERFSRTLRVEEDEPGSLAIVCGKIRRLRLQISENGLDGLAQAAIADRGNSRLHGNRNLK